MTSPISRRISWSSCKTENLPHWPQPGFVIKNRYKCYTLHKQRPCPVCGEAAGSGHAPRAASPAPLSAGCSSPAAHWNEQEPGGGWLRCQRDREKKYSNLKRRPNPETREASRSFQTTAHENCLSCSLRLPNAFPSWLRECRMYKGSDSNSPGPVYFPGCEWPFGCGEPETSDCERY